MPQIEMQVICIDNTAECHPDTVGNFMVIEGNVYTVNGEFEEGGEYWYQLEEDTEGNGWNKMYFIPLSNVQNKMLVYESQKV